MVITVFVREVSIADKIFSTMPALLLLQIN
nr:MAG TPA: hypothetical protein [Caudoviricetes sp.]